MGNNINRRRNNVTEVPRNPSPAPSEVPPAPLPRSRSRRNSKKSVASNEEVKKKKKVQCCACAEEIDESHGGLHCKQGHHVCLKACAKTFVDSQLADGLSAVPLKCPLCKIEYNENIVERVMEIEQMDKYVRLVLTKKLLENPDDGETLVTCPNCNYYEYRHANIKEIMFVYCQDPNCKKITCSVCKKTLNGEAVLRLSEFSDAYGDSDEDGDEQNEFDQHLECHQLQDLKIKFEKLLEKGQGGECPKCHLVGNKNPGECNHMTCPECGTEWCYMCGKDKAAFNLEEDDSFWEHFNESDCVMYLYQIQEGSENSDTESNNSDDENEDEEIQNLQNEAENIYHRNKTLTLLKEFENEIGADIYEKLAKQFPLVGNSGYSLEEVKNFIL